MCYLCIGTESVDREFGPRNSNDANLQVCVQYCMSHCVSDYSVVIGQASLRPLLNLSEITLQMHGC